MIKRIVVIASFVLLLSTVVQAIDVQLKEYEFIKALLSEKPGCTDSISVSWVPAPSKGYDSSVEVFNACTADQMASLSNSPENAHEYVGPVQAKKVLDIKYRVKIDAALVKNVKQDTNHGLSINVRNSGNNSYLLPELSFYTDTNIWLGNQNIVGNYETLQWCYADIMSLDSSKLHSSYGLIDLMSQEFLKGLM